MSNSNTFAEFFQDQSGGNSAMRLMSVIVILGIFIVWVIVSLRTTVMADIPQSVVEFAAAVLAGKVIQHFSEVKSPTNPTNPTNP